MRVNKRIRTATSFPSGFLYIAMARIRCPCMAQKQYLTFVLSRGKCIFKVTKRERSNGTIIF